MSCLLCSGVGGASWGSDLLLSGVLQNGVFKNFLISLPPLKYGGMSYKNRDFTGLPGKPLRSGHTGPTFQCDNSQLSGYSLSTGHLSMICLRPHLCYLSGSCGYLVGQLCYGLKQRKIKELESIFPLSRVEAG